MLNWKLLGDLSPRELKLECERAGLAASDKDSHNFIRLSKYIMSNGYDPETFFFNTLYQADKTNPLVGMTPSNNPRAEHVASLQAKVTISETLICFPNINDQPWLKGLYL